MLYSRAVNRLIRKPIPTSPTEGMGDTRILFGISSPSYACPASHRPRISCCCRDSPLKLPKEFSGESPGMGLKYHAVAGTRR